MGFADTGGITSLSQLIIDADKDWNLMGMSDIKEVVLGMVIGDIVYHDGTKLVKLSPGALGTELVTEGLGYPPKWSFPDVG